MSESLPVVPAVLEATAAPQVRDVPTEKFFGMLPPEFDKLAAGGGWPRYRAQQVRQWVYEKGVGQAHEKTNLSKFERERLAASVAFARSKIVRHQSSEDGTQKLLLEWDDGS